MGNESDAKLHLEQWEELLLQLNDMRIYRRIVGSLAGSCLKAAIPLLSSLKESACLLALNITEVLSCWTSHIEFFSLRNDLNHDFVMSHSL